MTRTGRRTPSSSPRSGAYPHHRRLQPPAGAVRQGDPPGRDPHGFQLCKRHASPSRRPGRRRARAYARTCDRRLRGGAHPLRDALATLIEELTRPPPPLSWRKLRLPGRRHADRMTPAPKARTRPAHADGDSPAAPRTPSAAQVRRADRSALRPNSARTHEPVAGETGFPDLGQRKAPDQREVERVLSRCAGRAASGSSTCRRRARRKLDGPYRWGRRRHSRGVDPGDRGGRRARRRRLGLYWGRPPGTRRPRLSPCRAMGVRR